MKRLLAFVNYFCTVCELLCNIMSHCTHKSDRCSHRTASPNCFPALRLCSNWGSHALVYYFKILTVTGQCFNVTTIWRYWPSPDRVWRSPDKLSRACHSPDMFSCTRQISRTWTPKRFPVLQDYVGTMVPTHWLVFQKLTSHRNKLSGIWLFEGFDSHRTVIQGLHIYRTNFQGQTQTTSICTRS